MNDEREFDVEEYQANIDEFKRLIPYFYLEKASGSLVGEELDRNRSGEFKNPLNLPLGYDGRLWLQVPTEHTLGYKKYYSLMEGVWWSKFLEGTIDQYREMFLELMTPKVYKDGKYQGQKLFKFLLKKGYFDQTQVETVTTIRDNSDWFCISKNPVDLLFCSTGHSWGSCISLESDYERAYYMGLPVVLVDPDRYIIFSGSKKKHSYRVKGLDIEYHKYYSRSWGIATDDGRFVVVKSYPETKVDFCTVITELLGIETVPDNGDKGREEWEASGKNYQSNTFHETLYNENGDRISIYHDTYCGWNEEKERRYQGGYTSGHIDDTTYTYMSGFDYLYHISDLERCAQIYCTECDDSYDEDDDDYEGTYVDGNWYCSTCFDRLFGHCSQCEEYFRQNELTLALDGYDYCERCADKYLHQCEQCGEYFHFESDDATYAETTHGDCRYEFCCDRCCTDYIDSHADQFEEEEEEEEVCV